jgi:hypothetical protein
MERTDKIWLYGGVSFSLIASLIVAVSFSRGVVTAELALAGTSIKVCDLVFGETSSKTIAWMNQVDNLLQKYNRNPVYEKTISEFVLPNLREALRRCGRQNPVAENDFDATAGSLLFSDKRFSSPLFYEDMENVRSSIVKHWGKDSQKLITVYVDSQDILNCLLCRYIGNQSDQNIDYSVAMGFEACRLAKLYNDDQVLWTTSQNLVRVGEYYFVHKQYAKCADFYQRVLDCVPATLDYEGHMKALIEDRVKDSKSKQAGRVG